LLCERRNRTYDSERRIAGVGDRCYRPEDKIGLRMKIHLPSVVILIAAMAMYGVGSITSASFLGAVGVGLEFWFYVRVLRDGHRRSGIE